MYGRPCVGVCKRCLCRGREHPRVSVSEEARDLGPTGPEEQTVPGTDTNTLLNYFVLLFFYQFIKV